MNKVLVALALFAPAFAADECAVTEVDVHSTEGSADRGSLELEVVSSEDLCHQCT